MRGRDIELQLLDEPRQAWGLAFGKLENKATQRRRVDDRVYKGTLESTTDQPRVECVMAVLDEHGTMREAQKRTTRVLEFGRTDQHRAIDVMSLSRVGIDRGAAIDQGIEERQSAVEGEPLGTKLENQKWSVAGGLDVEGHELCLI